MQKSPDTITEDRIPAAWVVLAEHLLGINNEERRSSWGIGMQSGLTLAMRYPEYARALLIILNKYVIHNEKEMIDLMESIIDVGVKAYPIEFSDECSEI